MKMGYGTRQLAGPGHAGALRVRGQRHVQRLRSAPRGRVRRRRHDRALPLPPVERDVDRRLRVRRWHLRELRSHGARRVRRGRTMERSGMGCSS